MNNYNGTLAWLICPGLRVLGSISMGQGELIPMMKKTNKTIKQNHKLSTKQVNSVSNWVADAHHLAN